MIVHHANRIISAHQRHNHFGKLMTFFPGTRTITLAERQLELPALYAVESALVQSISRQYYLCLSSVIIILLTD